MDTGTVISSFSSVITVIIIVSITIYAFVVYKPAVPKKKTDTEIAADKVIADKLAADKLAADKVITDKLAAANSTGPVQYCYLNSDNSKKGPASGTVDPKFDCISQVTECKGGCYLSTSPKSTPTTSSNPPAPSVPSSTSSTSGPSGTSTPSNPPTPSGTSNLPVPTSADNTKICQARYPGISGTVFAFNESECYSCDKGHPTYTGNNPKTEFACKGTMDTIKASNIISNKIIGNESMVIESDTFGVCPTGTTKNKPITDPVPCLGECNVLYGIGSFQDGISGVCYNCPGGTNVSPGNCDNGCEPDFKKDINGMCYQCPAENPNRTLDPVTSATACQKTIFDKAVPAIIGKPWKSGWVKKGDMNVPLKVRESIFTAATLLGSTVQNVVYKNLKQKATGKCLDGNVNSLTLNGCSTTNDYQNWQLDNGLLKQKATGKCLDGNAAGLTINDCSAANDYQNWQFENGLLKQKASGKCLDGNSAGLTLTDCSTTNDYQNWIQ